jgi:hypothetical protein
MSVLIICNRSRSLDWFFEWLIYRLLNYAYVVAKSLCTFTVALDRHYRVYISRKQMFRACESALCWKYYTDSTFPPDSFIFVVQRSCYLPVNKFIGEETETQANVTTICRPCVSARIWITFRWWLLSCQLGQFISWQRSVFLKNCVILIECVGDGC